MNEILTKKAINQIKDRLIYPDRTKAAIEVLNEEKYFNPKQDNALTHYNKMKAYALTQPPDDKPSAANMRDAIDENWGAKDCPYCNTRNEDTKYCQLAPLNFCNDGSNCCDGAWVKLSRSETWEEWLEHADKVIDYIEKHGWGEGNERDKI